MAYHLAEAFSALDGWVRSFDSISLGVWIWVGREGDHITASASALVLDWFKHGNQVWMEVWMVCRIEERLNVLVVTFSVATWPDQKQDTFNVSTDYADRALLSYGQLNHDPRVLLVSFLAAG